MGETMLARVRNSLLCGMPKCPTIRIPGMEKPESSAGGESAGELEDRDPNSLNQHLQVMWDDVIGEPEGIRSPECAWRLSGHCFRLSRGCCYILLSVLVAPLLALLFGFMFACLAFQHIWCLAPCLRIWKITCAAMRNFLAAVTQAIIRPLMEGLGYLCYNIRIFNQRLPDGPLQKEDLLIV
ncbi:caveolin-3 isoform X1 [Solenopsis invicta]|uniref:caveolin-3 isoform X1 n=2 Tax=Solenopsis invicta TaxID=13686 RepID=UPI0005958AA9|nr:caveolin-3 isoform X1 [Solenopsis invicta]XP_011157541.1 caveolin-3 isoform X1 [Solenopsis invicta]XP_025992791.1 caveolin-3 isoform X1 [Solenopsis invicta]XP_025992792.1 caveolin-3 isoform X1 [Solenopsis invicta]